MKAKYHDAVWSVTEAVVHAVAFAATGGLIVLKDIEGWPTIQKALRVAHPTFSLDRWRLPHALHRAEFRGLIRIRRSRGGVYVIRVTDKGSRMLARRQLEGAAVKRPKRWDRKWRILIFDVPERQRRDRDILRRTLQNLGFQQLQESVWVYPYDCRALVATMRTAYGLSHIIVRYIEANAIEDDESLRLHFDI